MAEPNVTQMGSKFNPVLVSDLFNKVKGHSTLAKLSGQSAIPFTGKEVFTFDMQDGVQIVGESGQKKDNHVTMEPVTIKPLKMVYQHRFSDEFLKASAEQKLNYLKAFNDGAAMQFAKAIDIAAIHGYNPYNDTVASFQATNSFDGLVENKLTYDPEGQTALDDTIDTIITEDLEGKDVTGIAFAPTAGSYMSKIKVNGVVQYPEFRFGGKPDSFAGRAADVNNTIQYTGTGAEDTDIILLGDFQNAFQWGYAEEMPLEVIEYGDPDGTGRDLKAYNEVCLRLEAYIGWGILDKDAFGIINVEA